MESAGEELLEPFLLLSEWLYLTAHPPHPS
jgi:hypothetical protein